jgi:Transcriptional Coactivator p15 (PC4)
MSDPILIEKNSRESLRLSVDEFKGRILLSARVWFKPSDGGDLRPGRDGWAINVDKLPQIIAELQRIETEARAAGMLS